MAKSRTQATSVRLSEEDRERVRGILGHALKLGRTMNTSQALRLQLYQGDIEKISVKAIDRVLAEDGRRKADA